MTNELENLCHLFQQYQVAQFIADTQSEEDSDIKDEQYRVATRLYVDVLDQAFPLMEELMEVSGRYVDNAKHIVKALERIVGKAQ